MICARSAEASFVPTMLARSPARASVVAAVMLHAVRPGTLYSTTGWQAREAAVRRVVDERGAALIYGANFSIGVNLFYQIVARSAALFHGLAGYDPFIEEAHHAAKRDAPSGTALALKDILLRGLGRSDVPLTSTRAGHIPGTHRVGFDSLGDQVLLTHTARSRETFAAGALLAARWLSKGGRRGMYAFADVLDDMLAMERKAV